MGNLFCTGDTHRNDVDRFLPYFNLSKDDIMVVLGDWGVIWYGENKFQSFLQKQYYPVGSYDDCVLDRWETYGFSTFVVPGNHDNYDMIEKYPLVEKYSGLTREIRPHIHIATNGEIYNLNGAKCFVMGGAPSIDKYMRVEHWTWWKQEIPSHTEFNHGFDRLDECDWNVDYVFSHEAPDYVLSVFDYKHNILSNYLDVVDTRLINQCPNFKHHYFGHHHVDRVFTPHATCLFHDVIKLEI